MRHCAHTLYMCYSDVDMCVWGGGGSGSVGTCSAAPTDQAYISRTHPSFSFDSASCSMWYVSLSHSGQICAPPSTVAHTWEAGLQRRSGAAAMIQHLW